MKSRIVQIKLCKPNEIKNFGRFLFDGILREKQVVLYKIFHICTFIFFHTFSQLTMTPELWRKSPQIHISRFIFVISMMLMNVFNSLCFLLELLYLLFIFVISFFVLLSCLYIIVNDLCKLFLCSRKTIQNVTTKMQEPHKK